MVTCSDDTYRFEAMAHIETKLCNSGYKTNELTKAKQNALKIDCSNVIACRLSEKGDKVEKIEKSDNNETRI